MHSTVRSQSDSDFSGSAYEQPFVLADVRLQWPLPGDEVRLFFSPRGLVVVAPLPGGHHRVVATVVEAQPHPTLDDLQALLIERGPRDTRVQEVIWSSRFRVHHRLPASYRHGRTFLAGDAAHVHSPAGGQGVNTGIQDGVDLASTLREVPSGESGVEALDGYERRRRPVAQSVVSFTDRMTRAATATSPVARLFRNAAMSGAMRLPAVRHNIAIRLAELSQ
jgi:2-polyprenyl-6-methoxyphenol hydroxylase-like FAD-dependent oxidoreductase